MRTFNPPVAFTNPAILPDMRGLQYGLWRHYDGRAKGNTLILKKDGTCVTVDTPAEMTSNASPFESVGLAGILYTDIQAVYWGGHVYEVTDEEAALLEACGHTTDPVPPDPNDPLLGYGEGGYGEDGYGA